MPTQNLTVYFIEKVPEDILQGLSWVKMDYNIAQRLQIPVKYTGVIAIPNPEPYCCPIHPEDKLPWIKPNYQSHYYIHPPEIRGKKKKFLLHIKGENIALYAQYSLTTEAIVSWLLSCKDSGGRVLTKGTLEEEYRKYEPKPASRFRPRKLEPAVEGRTGRDNY